MRIAIQGIEGSFHHEAADILARDRGQELALDCQRSFEDVFTAVRTNRSKYGLVAIENNIDGPINTVYSLFDENDMWIDGSVRMQISQNLIGLKESDLAGLEEGRGVRVLSHEVALGQVKKWLDINLPYAERVERDDTASSVKEVVETGDKKLLAVAGKLATTIHQGGILAANIQDDADNFTRFMLFRKDRVDTLDANIGSMILQVPHKKGALVKALKIFDKFGCNLEMLHSHPIPSNRRRYQFFIDYQLNKSNCRLIRKLEDNKKHSVKLLGYHKYIEVKNGTIREIPNLE